jgi:hypothetical protein
MANGSLTAHATLTQTMRRLVSISELADEVMRRPDSLIMVTIGGASAQLQRHFLLQVVDAETKGLLEIVRRLLPAAELPARLDTEALPPAESTS